MLWLICRTEDWENERIHRHKTSPRPVGGPERRVGWVLLSKSAPFTLSLIGRIVAFTNISQSPRPVGLARRVGWVLPSGSATFMLLLIYRIVAFTDISRPPGQLVVQPGGLGWALLSQVGADCSIGSIKDWKNERIPEHNPSTKPVGGPARRVGWVLLPYSSSFMLWLIGSILEFQAITSPPPQPVGGPTRRVGWILLSRSVSFAL